MKETTKTRKQKSVPKQVCTTWEIPDDFLFLRGTKTVDNHQWVYSDERHKRCKVCDIRMVALYDGMSNLYWVEADPKDYKFKKGK